MLRSAQRGSHGTTTAAIALGGGLERLIAELMEMGQCGGMNKSKNRHRIMDLNMMLAIEKKKISKFCYVISVNWTMW